MSDSLEKFMDSLEKDRHKTDYLETIEKVYCYVDEENRMIALEPDFGTYIQTRTLNSKVFEKFLTLNKGKYFSIEDVANILKITRGTVERFIKSDVLKTYSVEFVHGAAAKDMPGRVTSNIKHVICRDDLLECLSVITTRSYSRLGSFSKHSTGAEQDIFKRGVRGKSDEVFYIFEEELDKGSERQERLFAEILDGGVVLHTINSLQEILGKSRATISRAIKALPTIHFKMSDGDKDYPRIVLRTGVEGEVEYPLQLVYYVSSYVTDILPINFEMPFEYREYNAIETPFDFIELYFEENYSDKPDFFTIVKDKIYFCVDARKAVAQNLNEKYIVREIEEQKKKKRDTSAEKLIPFFRPL